MRKLLLVLALCGALIAGVTIVPSTYAMVSLRWSMAQNPNAWMLASASPKFWEVLFDWLVQELVQQAWGGATSTRVGAIEKLLAGNKELHQAAANNDAALVASATYQRATSTFTPGNLERACRIMKEETETQDAALNAKIEEKASAIQESREFNSGKPSAVAVKEVVDRHNTTYCSQEGINQGRCTTLSNLPDADILASTLLQGEGSETYSKEQYAAAKAFSRVVTNPAPPDDVPAGIEGTSAGQRFLLERMQYAALMSMSQQTYTKILAARSPTK